MLVRLLESCKVRGICVTSPGELLEIPPDEAMRLIHAKQAEAVVEKIETVETREPEVEVRDPVVKPKRRKQNIP